MVFCGKPSKACAPCRSRRTRCDSTRPSCGQCIRAGRSCTGYRDPVNLIFRHETDKVRIRSGDRDGIGTVFASSPNLDRRARSKSWSEPLSTQDGYISRSLSPSPEDQATCFFFQNYVLDEGSLSSSYFDYLPTMYGESRENNILADAIIANGLAGLANYRRESDVMLKANLRYYRAVRAMSDSLGDTKRAKEDQTLIAVMLLGLFEANAFDTPQSLRSWSTHIRGAMAMLRLRGIEQLETDIGRRIFAQIRTQIVTTCFQRNCPVPLELWQWSEVLRPYHDAQDVHDFIDIAFKFCNLRSSMTSLFDYSNPTAVLLEGLVVDSMLHNWVKNAPPRFSRTTIPISQPSEDVFEDHYHVYTSAGTASVVNNYRCIRIILHEIIISQIAYLIQSPLSPHHQATYRTQLSTSKSLIQQLKRDVCASVPFYFEYHKETSNPKATVRAINGSFLLWYLYAIGISGKVEDKMKSWIVGRVDAIAERMGIRHAVGLAQVLRMGKEFSVWDEAKAATSPNADDWEGSTKELLTADK